MGTNRKQYSIHEKLLRSHSRYLEQAVEGAIEDENGTAIYLHDVDVEAFERFVGWMYRGAARSMQADTKWFGGCGHGELYFPAGEWEMEDLQNHVMDSLISWCRENDGRVGGEDIRNIFQETTRASPLRRFVVAQSAHFLSTTQCSQEEDSWRELIDIGGDFGFDLMKLMCDPSRRISKDPVA